ncbi:MAG TPA: tripartite tricarboxylate transporter substrate binding protein [Xanthobacteraceae bacterium]|jgi:tripartite-type tricarboxylate transporter receptor subunit TctC|nr:tripartite tricarboxylate transporter substrate binding protein [Xanthobacteraceae bacterium]
MFRRLRAVAIVAGLLVAGFCSSPLFAQDYPTRPVTIVVAQPPGGGTDIIARIIANQLSIQMGQPFVVENKAGAGTVVGTAFAASAAPDGYTLLTGLTANMAVNPSLFTKLAYDPIRDFTPVGMLATFPFAVVVSNNFPAHSIKELIEMAKAKPGDINFASGGNGTGQHLSTELFELEAGIKMTHVPYRGATPAYADVMSGQTPVFFDNLASALGQIQGGSVRALAVTGKERSPLLPNVPTVAESGLPEYDYEVWFGLWAPKNTPRPIVEKLYAEIQKALDNPDVKKRITEDTGTPMKMPLADIEPFVKSEIAKWADVIKRGGVAVQD